MLKRVLIVDSVNTVADAAAMLLANRGYKARAAYSAEHAVSIAKELRPQVLVSDALLLGTDGIELAAWFRKNIPVCKVVLISFNPSVRCRIEEAKQRGDVDEFISRREDLGGLLGLLEAITPDG